MKKQVSQEVGDCFQDVIMPWAGTGRSGIWKGPPPPLGLGPVLEKWFFSFSAVSVDNELYHFDLALISAKKRRHAMC